MACRSDCSGRTEGLLWGRAGRFWLRYFVSWWISGGIWSGLRDSYGAWSWRTPYNGRIRYRRAQAGQGGWWNNVCKEWWAALFHAGIAVWPVNNINVRSDISSLHHAFYAAIMRSPVVCCWEWNTGNILVDWNVLCGSVWICRGRVDKKCPWWSGQHSSMHFSIVNWCIIQVMLLLRKV